MRAAEETPLVDRLLRIGGVDHVVALHEEGLESLERIATLPSPFAAPIRVFRVPGAWPRSYVVAGRASRTASRRSASWPIPRSIPPGRSCCRRAGETPAAAGAVGTSRILELRHDRVRLEAELAAARPPGAGRHVRPRVEGHRGRTVGNVLRANGAFRAVRLDPGRHLVEMLYRPRFRGRWGDDLGGEPARGRRVRGGARSRGVPVSNGEEPIHDEVRRFYEENHDGIERARRARRYFYDYLTRVLRTRIPPGQRILDVGLRLRPPAGRPGAVARASASTSPRRRWPRPRERYGGRRPPLPPRRRRRSRGAGARRAGPST